MNSPIAWIGALTGSASLFWNIYTWLYKGPKLVVRAHPNWKIAGGAERDDRKWIYVGVSNRGDAPTMIASLSVMHFSNYWRRVQVRASVPAMLVPRPDGPALPFRLQPGDEWIGLALQEPLEQAAREHNWRNGLYVAIHHSMSAKPKLAKITKRLRLGE